MAHKTPYSLNESADYRLASGVCNKNDGLAIQQSPDIGDLENFNNELLGDSVQNTSLSPDDIIKLVFFHLETSGLAKSADILQIAAKCEEQVFCEYARPTQKITREATSINGLSCNVYKELFLRGKKIDSRPLKEVLSAFKEWLTLSKPCILVAHNGANFDTPLLLRALKNNSMIEDFKNIIIGFSDTFVTLKKLYPQRKGKGMFKLPTLAKDFLELTDGNFHDAMYYVEILTKIASKKIPKKNLIEERKSFTESLNRKEAAELQAQSLYVLKGVISEGMIKKIAMAGISYEKLQDIFKEGGKDDIIGLLSAKQEDNKPLVTKDKKILEKILAFFIDANKKN